MQINRITFLLTFLLIAIIACKQENKPAEALTKEEEIAQNLTLLKETARDGDLVVRLNDDFISEQLRYFNEKDKSFSHSGIVITKGKEKMVCSILPGLPTSNPILYVPIDSFLDIQTNTQCGLFRYDITDVEKTKFINSINNLATQKKIYFDSAINIWTDDSLYCSEMICKTLAQATSNRITFRLVPIAPKMQKTLFKFYRGRISKDSLATRQLMVIDNLYNIPQCKELMRFKLKYFPGQ